MRPSKSLKQFKDWCILRRFIKCTKRRQRQHVVFSESICPSDSMNNSELLKLLDRSIRRFCLDNAADVIQSRYAKDRPEMVQFVLRTVFKDCRACCVRLFPSTAVSLHESRSPVSMWPAATPGRPVRAPITGAPQIDEADRCPTHNRRYSGMDSTNKIYRFFKDLQFFIPSAGPRLFPSKSYVHGTRAAHADRPLPALRTRHALPPGI